MTDMNTASDIYACEIISTAEWAEVTGHDRVAVAQTVKEGIDEVVEQLGEEASSHGGE